MKNIDEFRKYFNIILLVIVFVCTIISIIAFIDTEIIDNLIINISKNEYLVGIFVSFVAIIIVFMYSYFIRKIFKSKKICVFLSYAYSSKEEIKKIREVLTITNNYKIYDFDSIPIGQNIQIEIRKMFDTASLFIILFDENYFMSDHCSLELNEIIKSGKIIIPILKSKEYDSKLPSEISKLKYLLISDNESWEETFKRSLWEQYKIIRTRKQEKYEGF
jgi:hypothetical protein